MELATIILNIGIVLILAGITAGVTYAVQVDRTEEQLIRNEAQIKMLEKKNERLLRKLEAKEVTQ